MSAEHRAVYLNDHLAGSVAALGLLDDLRRDRAGTPAGDLAGQLHAEISEERDVLQALMARIGVSPSVPRRVAGWIGRVTADLKLAVDDSASGPLRLLEIAEAVGLGIEGKTGLWRALGRAAERDEALRGPDYPALVERSESQRRRAEALRLEAAAVVLTAG